MGIQVDLDLSGANGNISDYGKIPKGTYALTVVEVDAKEAKSGNGHVMALKVKVAEGAFTGKCIGHNLNVIHNSVEAQKIGQDGLKQIMTQIGHPNPDKLGNTDELINGQVFHAEVDIEGYTNGQGEARESSKISKIVSKETPLKDGSLDAAPAAATGIGASLPKAQVTTASPFAKTETAAAPVGADTGAADLGAATGGGVQATEKKVPAWMQKK